MSATLTIDGISKRYGDVVALDNLSFEVRPGEIFGFVGSNGAGKTTTMRIALGVLGADSGEVRLGGKPVDLDVRRTIGYMPEERGLYPKMKVGAQLSYLAELHGLSKADAHAATERWTERLGIAERVKDTVDSLSLGNQQRVQLAAALVHDPSVLVLDEPFSGLDPVAVDVMSDVLVEKARTGVPVIFSSHQLDLVERLCDRVGIISRGSMREIGTVDELRGKGDGRIEVFAPDAPVGWAHHLIGVTTLSHLDGRTLLSVDGTADDQQILHAALKTGPVHEFTLRRPSLTDLFREVVAA
ncbi:ABC transporter ATP-binding protein [Rhodococcus qingshengii]|jgi:ABC-2 type transport system ATP-binding protein|uniref:ABC transporter ATP-binding protein n=3 Tax=Rhodococcus erythropolis group TaxID=2840174 RepID=A0A1Q4K2N8_RHOER|nr:MULTISPECIES: ATP-binding cassette domain-containing protein [Rhodococcus]EEN89656.1 ABC transporter, ATP-binding protein [Rhodococcus erythropolis SK121]NHE66586.1 ABC transporter ATP-binding protein [Rhodococcus sp. D-46]OCC20582.1 ABC transporter ATP-binding protein [Prescottella equi]ANQ69935.1 ABC transporter ATP-binding protein [Rhodococcus sp. 008]ARE35639.1 ABC transporter ATP-binding protein [Rhodococcus sp. BH4]